MSGSTERLFESLPFAFDGPDFDPERDQARLTGQMMDIFRLMKDGRKRTVRQIAAITGHPETSISAQLRHLRKPRFGGYAVQKERVEESGLWRYWIDFEKKGRVL